MNLALYSSKPRGGEPNLAAVQDPALDMLPTVLVCPLKTGLTLTALRIEIDWNGRIYTAAFDLVRPVNRKALRPVGELDSGTSRKLIETLLLLLPS